MANDTLNVLLKDYEHKRLSAELDLEKRKSDLYSLFPKLEQIESELNSFAIATAKSILSDSSKKNNSNSKSVYSLDELYKKIDNLKKQRQKILVSNGYSPSYLKPFYECNICNDSGFIEGNYGKEMCSCLKQRLLDISYNNSNMHNLKSENFDTFNADIFSDEVDLSKYGQNISPRKNIMNIRDKAIDFVNNFDDPSYKNLLFTGNTGLRQNFYF